MYNTQIWYYSHIALIVKEWTLEMEKPTMETIVVFLSVKKVGQHQIYIFSGQYFEKPFGDFLPISKTKRGIKHYIHSSCRLIKPIGF